LPEYVGFAEDGIEASLLLRKDESGPDHVSIFKLTVLEVLE
jgi:hypothetical protein